MLNDFLITDVNQNTAFCNEILAAIETPVSDEKSFSGNVYTLTITSTGATLSNLHDESIDSESFDLTDLKASLIEWQAKIR
ncbi:MAG: hypothetical protein KAG26_06760 [Methylococcales bacterium]|nr:hypothetical protein [Methylococcales bacterium]